MYLLCALLGLLRATCRNHCPASANHIKPWLRARLLLLSKHACPTALKEATGNPSPPKETIRNSLIEQRHYGTSRQMCTTPHQTAANSYELESPATSTQLITARTLPHHVERRIKESAQNHPQDLHCIVSASRVTLSTHHLQQKRLSRNCESNGCNVKT